MTHTYTYTKVAVPVLYLDLDGTVRLGKDELGHFVNHPDDVSVFPEAIELMRGWRKAGGRILGITNQGGVALGYLTRNNALAMNVRTQKLCNGLFDEIMMCTHHPDAADSNEARCWCRKPRPGMVIEGAAFLRERHEDEYYPPHLALLVGDRPEDRECAHWANIDFMSAKEWREGA